MKIMSWENLTEDLIALWEEETREREPRHYWIEARPAKSGKSPKGLVAWICSLCGITKRGRYLAKARVRFCSQKCSSIYDRRRLQQLASQSPLRSDASIKIEFSIMAARRLCRVDFETAQLRLPFERKNVTDHG